MDPRGSETAAEKERAEGRSTSATDENRSGKETSVEDMMKNLKLTAAEADRLVDDDDDEETEKPMWALAAWGNPKGLLFRDGGKNMFIAELDSEWDRDRIWERSPWMVNKCAVVLENFHHWSRPSEMKFDKLLIWVRVIDLPYNKLNETWGEKIARKVGEFIKLDINKGGLVSAQYLRAKVCIKVKEPLMRWVGLDSKKLGRTFWYSVQYEFLPYFCFSCGVLGHSDTVCPMPSERDEKGNLPWGPYLRAPNDFKKKASHPFAEGGYDDSYTEFKEEGTRDYQHERGKDAPDVIPPARAPMGGRGRGRNLNMRGGKLPVYRKLTMSPADTNVGDLPSEQNPIRDLVMFEPHISGSKREEAELRKTKEGLTPDAKKKKNNPPLASAAEQPRRDQ
ncbi:hypothetical protein ACQ4PT_029164 [Festuca glaucescens]